MMTNPVRSGEGGRESGPPGGVAPGPGGGPDDGPGPSGEVASGAGPWSQGGRPATASNRFGLDYRDAARAMGPPRGPDGAPIPIIDLHTHVSGVGAAPIWREAAWLYGVRRVFTQVPLPVADSVQQTLGDLVRFIAFPNFRHPDRRHAFTQGYLDDLPVFRERFNARIAKLWNAPRMHEFFPGNAGADLIEFDSPWRVRHATLAQSLGMMLMVHVADPDTWFATRYKDPASFGGTKRDHYRGLEVMLDRVEGPWIAAHMGGWPEDLRFLDGLLSRHPNLVLDTSATKWVVRELSRHPPDETRDFLARFRGRVLFGTDVVTTDEHLAPKAAPGAHPIAELADSPDAAFDLYASRYFTLRTLFETGYDGPSPIADPDLMMVDPTQHGPMSAPRLRGLRLPPDLLRELYHDAAARLLARVGVEV